MRRGDIYIGTFPPPVGRRPVLIVTRTPALAVREVVTVAPITRTIRGIASELPLGAEQGLRRPSVASCDSLQTVARSSLGRRRIGGLDAADLVRLDRALMFALGIRSSAAGG